MKKVFLYIISAAMCLLLCSCGTTADTSVSENTDPDVEISSGDSDENTESRQSESDCPDTAAPEITEDAFKINEDIISELGMTYSQLIEKYGDPKGGIYNVYVFENGYGRYVWKSNEDRSFDDMETAGGCNMIDGVDIEKLFSISTYPISFDELVNRYGFVVDSVGNEIEMDNLYWSELTYPLYDNVSFIFAAAEYGSIDKDTSCCIIMNADCMDASPVLFD